MTNTDAVLDTLSRPHNVAALTMLLPPQYYCFVELRPLTKFLSCEWAIVYANNNSLRVVKTAYRPTILHKNFQQRGTSTQKGASYHRGTLGQVFYRA
jgi:hypothetical protein